MLLVSLIVIIIGSFTSCIDVIQVVSIKHGVIYTSIRYSLEKTIFELAASFSGETIDYDEYLDIGDDAFSVFKGVSGEIKKHETPYEIGAEVTFEGKETLISSLLDGEVEFIPIKKNNAYYIEIPLIGESGEDIDENELGFLAGSKYRMVVALTDDLKNISKAQLSLELTSGVSNTLTKEEGVSVSITGAIMLIDIPMSIIFIDEGKIIIKLS